MATQSRKVYITPSLFFAFIDRAHPKHAVAQAYFRHFAENNYRLYTDQVSLAGCYTDIRRHISNSIAKEFLRAVVWGSVEVIAALESEEKEALKLLGNVDEPSYTYQNALISVLAYRRDIPQIATLGSFHPSFGQSVFFLPV